MEEILFTALLLASATHASANDGIGSLGVGGIVFGKTDTIAMKKEVLNISWKKISVDYEFLNESNSDVVETIFFPLPDYQVDPNPRHSGQPDQFSITVDGKIVGYKTILRSFMDSNDEDITQDLRKIGLNDEEIAFFPFEGPFRVKVKPLTKKQVTQLQTKGYIQDNSGLYPAWTVRIAYQWTQRFPAGKTVHVHHEYSPFNSNGPAEMGTSDKQPILYCADKNYLKSWHKLRINDKNNESISNTVVEYILKTGNTWKNGIEDFTLNLIKESPSELITLCFPGDFRRTSPTNLQLHMTNFRPTEDLSIFYGNLNSDEFVGRNGRDQPPSLK